MERWCPQERVKEAKSGWWYAHSFHHIFHQHLCQQQLLLLVLVLVVVAVVVLVLVLLLLYNSPDATNNISYSTHATL